jgi:hypothetical protein
LWLYLGTWCWYWGSWRSSFTLQTCISISLEAFYICFPLSSWQTINLIHRNSSIGLFFLTLFLSRGGAAWEHCFQTCVFIFSIDWVHKCRYMLQKSYSNLQTYAKITCFGCWNLKYDPDFPTLWVVNILWAIADINYIVKTDAVIPLHHVWEVGGLQGKSWVYSEVIQSCSTWLVYHA